MHEHVRDELPYVEVGGEHEVQPHDVVEVYVPLYGQSGGVCQHVDDEQILRESGYVAHDVWSVIKNPVIRACRTRVAVRRAVFIRAQNYEKYP